MSLDRCLRQGWTDHIEDILDMVCAVPACRSETPMMKIVGLLSCRGLPASPTTHPPRLYSFGSTRNHGGYFFAFFAYRQACGGWHE